MSQILLVEDNPNQRMLYEQELMDEGYDNILTASSGSEGLLLFKHHRPDLIILDVLLPGIDGIEMLNQILAVDPQANVIVHSAFSSPSHDFITWYAKAYIVKSGDLREFIWRVKQALYEYAMRVDRPDKIASS